MDEQQSPACEPDREPTAVLVARVWFEPGGRFRARITAVADLASGEQVVSTHADPEAALDAVAAWLGAFAGGQGRDG